MTSVSNQSALQKFVDGNTTAVIDDPTSPYNGQRVSLAFNDVDTSDGAPLVLIGGLVAALSVGSPGADLTLTGTLTVEGATALEGDVGFNGATPVGKSAAYTQTYPTATRTVPAGTDTAVAQTSVAVPTTGATNSSPYGYSQAQANDIVTNVNAAVADIASLVTANTDIIADVLAIRKLINALIDDLVAVGLAQT